MAPAKWQADPVLVPTREWKAKYRVVFDLRQTNAVTVKESWPTQQIGSRISD